MNTTPIKLVAGKMSAAAPERPIQSHREDRLGREGFIRHLTVYGAGRSLSYNEVDTLRREGLKLKADGYRMKDMVRYVVNSKVFLEK